MDSDPESVRRICEDEFGPQPPATQPPQLKRFAISGPVSAERNVWCKVEIFGLEIRLEDAEAIQEFVYLLCDAFRRDEKRPAEVHEFPAAEGE